MFDWVLNASLVTSVEFDLVSLLIKLQLNDGWEQCDKQTILQEETHFKETKHPNFEELFIILSALLHFLATNL